MLLDLLNGMLSKLRSRGIADGDARKLIARFIHSPAVATLVTLTPTPADDVILEVLRTLVPPPV